MGLPSAWSVSKAWNENTQCTWHWQVEAYDISKWASAGIKGRLWNTSSSFLSSGDYCFWSASSTMSVVKRLRRCDDPCLHFLTPDDTHDLCVMCLGEEHCALCSRGNGVRSLWAFFLWESSALVCPFSERIRAIICPPAARVAAFAESARRLRIVGEIMKSWDKPYSARIHRYKHANHADIEGMPEHGYVSISPIEGTLASYLLAGVVTSTLKAPALPSKPLKDTSRLNGRAYVAVGSGGASCTRCRCVAGIPGWFAEGLKVRSHQTQNDANK